ncbi:hypothetical protein TNCV_3456881 [Trichonephila clavipes]|nr:hypothetical protein TNCV_3456881 [Trichonephila clavipes]
MVLTYEFVLERSGISTQTFREVTSGSIDDESLSRLLINAAFQSKTRGTNRHFLNHDQGTGTKPFIALSRQREPRQIERTYAPLRSGLQWQKNARLDHDHLATMTLRIHPNSSNLLIGHWFYSNGTRF